MTIRDLMWRLFLTRDDDLDVLQLLLALWIVFSGVMIALVGSGVWTIPTAGWTFAGSVFATVAILGASSWRTQELLAKRTDTQPTHSAFSPFTGRVDDPDA